MVIGGRKDGKGAVEERIRDSIATIFSKDSRCSHPDSICLSYWYRGMAETTIYEILYLQRLGWK